MPELTAPSAADERRERLRLLARVAPLFALAYAILWLVHLDTGPAIPRDGTSLVVGRDFLNFWMAGRAAWGEDPQRFYDLATYQAEVAKVTGPGYLGQVWSYPPSVMLPAAPFGLLPYLPALLLWTLIGPCVFLLALSRWTRDWRLILAALLAPAAVFGIISGQFAYLAAAIILTVLRLREARPWLAGALLGLLTIKPQLGLFFPFLLLATRNWRAIGGAAASSAALVALSMLLWGVEPWTAYLTEGIATQSRVLSDPEAIAGPFMATVLMNLRSAGVHLPWAQAAQALASLTAAALILWRFRTGPDPDDWNANTLFLGAALFGTPYLLSYDTLALATAVLFVAATGTAARLLLLGAYFLTLLQLVFGGLSIPGPALVPLLLALYLAKAPASSTWVDQRN